MSGDERLVVELDSRFGPLSVTESQEGRRSLWFGRGRVCQGIVEPGRVGCGGLPYAGLVLAGLALPPRLDDVLIIGLGAGVIPRFIHAHLPTTRIDVVEIDPVVVAVARRYFDVEPDARLRIHVADGRRHVACCEQRYDAIVLDGYGLHEVPPELSTREFLLAVRGLLRPGGVVLGNLWGDASQRHHARMLATYLDAFARVDALRTAADENTIVLARAEGQPLAQSELVARARELSRVHALPLDLGACVHSLAPVVVQAEALRD